MHDTLQRLVQVLNLQERVEIIGRISEAQIREYYQQADVFALPCEIQKDGDRDGIPNVLVEAMAMGIPVVSTQISGIPELIENDVNGFLVKDRDPAALADALADVLNDPELAARFGDAGRATVALEFDAKRNVEKIAELLWAALMSQSPHRTSPHTPQSSTLLEQLQAARESTVQTAATLGSDYDSDELK